MKKKILCIVIAVLITVTQVGAVFGAGILTTAKEGNVVPKLDAELQEAMADETAYVQRYIVKLRDTEENELRRAADVASVHARTAKSEQTDTQIENVQSEEFRGLMAFNHVDNKSVQATASVAQIESTEIADEKLKVITLTEAVDAETFMTALENEMGNRAAYIQPDYEMELAEENRVTFEVSDDAIQVQEAEEFVTTDEETQENTEETGNNQGLSENTQLPEEPVGPTDGQKDNQAESTNEMETDEAEPVLGDRLFDVEADLSGAWNISQGESIVVAVIDSGIDTSHPNLAEKTIAGWDFVKDKSLSGASEADSSYAHGTHVAGIIHHVAPAAKIMPLRVFENGKAYTSDILKAIAYAKENGASIVNCSWGAAGENPALKEAIEESGLTFVCAAGNNRRNLDETPVYPAAFGLDNVISVAALNSDLGMSYFSNYGAEKVDIAAWGRSVRSTLPDGGYGEMTGTSMSTAYVSGAAALAAVTGNGTVELKKRITESADKLSCLDNKVKDGAKINFTALVNGETITEKSSVVPEDDFDVFGYMRTALENWELYSSTQNVQVAAGYEHVLVLKENGTVWAWGRNSEAELGDNTWETRSVPQQVIGLNNIVQVAAGEMFSMALKNDGTVWTWGKNDSGQLGNSTYNTSALPVQVTGISAVQTIAAGYNHSLAVTETGDLYSWGSNEVGQQGNTGTTIGGNSSYPQFAGLSHVVSVAAGGEHTLAATENGDVYAWGSSAFGKTGHTETGIEKVAGLQNITQVTAGRWFSAALDANGTVWTWGRNEVKELGREISGEETSVPSAIPDLEDVVSISAMDRHTLAVKQDGTLWAWGWNAVGQVGDGTLENRQSPVKIMDNVLLPNSTEKLTASAGVEFSVVLDGNSKVVAWGNNSSGQLGDGIAFMTSTPVLSYEMGTDVKYISGGEENTVVLHENGQVSVWGENYCGELGRGTYGNADIPKEAKIQGLSNMISVDAGYHHTLALDADGKVWSWGKNANGQLGNGTQENNAATPSVVAENVKTIAAGNTHSLAVKNDGTILSWGDNSYGKLGETAGGVRLTPTALAPLQNVKAVAAGMDHSVALLEDGTVWTWGRNNRGQLGDGTQQDSAVPIQVTGLPTITAISAKGNHTMALDETGYVWLWGDNWYRQVMNDWQSEIVNQPTKRTDISNIVDISAHDRESMVLKSDGTVWGWGQNENGRLGDGSKTDRPEPVQMLDVAGVQAPENSTLGHSIAAGFFHAAANAGGQVYSTGWNNKAQLANGRVMNKNAPYEMDNAVNHFYGVSFDDAYQVAPGEIHSTVIDPAEEQYFYLNVTEDSEANYSIYSESDMPNDLSVTLYDEQKNVIVTGDDWDSTYAREGSTNPKDFIITKGLTSGKYYIKVTGNTANARYTMKIKQYVFEPKIEYIHPAPNVTLMMATAYWIPGQNITFDFYKHSNKVYSATYTVDDSGYFWTPLPYENVGTPSIYQLVITATGEIPGIAQQTVALPGATVIEPEETMEIDLDETGSGLLLNEIGAGEEQIYKIRVPMTGHYAIYADSEAENGLQATLLDDEGDLWTEFVNTGKVGDKEVKCKSDNDNDFMITAGLHPAGDFYVKVSNSGEDAQKVSFSMYVQKINLEAAVSFGSGAVHVSGTRFNDAALEISVVGENGVALTQDYYVEDDYGYFYWEGWAHSYLPGYTYTVTVSSYGYIPETLTFTVETKNDSRLQYINIPLPLEETLTLGAGQELCYSYVPQLSRNNGLILTALDTPVAVYIYDSLEDLWSDTPFEAYYCELETIESYTHLIKREMAAGSKYYIRFINSSNAPANFYLKENNLPTINAQFIDANTLQISGDCLPYKTIEQLSVHEIGIESMTDIGTYNPICDQDGNYSIEIPIENVSFNPFLIYYFEYYQSVGDLAVPFDRYENAYEIEEETTNVQYGYGLTGRELYFKFVPDITGEYEIYSSSKQHIRVDDDTNPEDYLVQNGEADSDVTAYPKILQTLEAGKTYYIKVQNLDPASDVYNFNFYITNVTVHNPNAEQIINCQTNQDVYVFVTGKNVTQFNKKYVLEYDAEKLQLVDPFVFGSAGISLEQQSGKLSFTVEKALLPGRAYYGILNAVKFKALFNGETTVKLKMEAFE